MLSSKSNTGRSSSNKKNTIRRSMSINILFCLLNYQAIHGYTINNPIFTNRNTFINNGKAFVISNHQRLENQHRTFRKPLLASTYDLGIGKNKPLLSAKNKANLKNGGKGSNDINNKNNDNHSHHCDTIDLDFMEHQSVSRYPSPFDNERRIKAAIAENNANDNDNNNNRSKEKLKDIISTDRKKESAFVDQQQEQRQHQQRINGGENMKKDILKKMKRTIIRPRPNRISEDFLTIVDSSLQNHHHHPRSDNNKLENIENANDNATFLPKAYARKRTSTSPITSFKEATAVTTMLLTKQEVYRKESMEKFDLNTVWVEMLIHDEQRQIYGRAQRQRQKL